MHLIALNFGYFWENFETFSDTDQGFNPALKTQEMTPLKRETYDDEKQVIRQKICIQNLSNPTKIGTNIAIKCGLSSKKCTVLL